MNEDDFQRRLAAKLGLKPGKKTAGEDDNMDELLVGEPLYFSRLLSNLSRSALYQSGKSGHGTLAPCHDGTAL